MEAPTATAWCPVPTLSPFHLGMTRARVEGPWLILHGAIVLDRLVESQRAGISYAPESGLLIHISRAILLKLPPFPLERENTKKFA